MSETTKHTSRLARQRPRLQRLARLMRESAARSGRYNIRAIASDLLHNTSIGQGILFRFGHDRASEHIKEYTIPLPAGYPARTARIRLSVPKLPPRPLLSFSDHVMDTAGKPTDTILAAMTGGFAISRDLGETWSIVKVRDKRFRRHQFIHVKSIGQSEVLAQTFAERWQPGATRVVNNLVLDHRGHVLAASRMQGSHWHGCRSVDIAGGTLMYAEYPYEDPAGTHADRAPSRVLRSHDRGRSWQVVFECNGLQVRHFHFLQARPDVPGEWWLTSGDNPIESRIWLSKDDGETWKDMTSDFGDPVILDGIAYPRTMFRLTDLAWQDGEVVWGTDDYLARNQFPDPGARMFRSPGDRLVPVMAGKAKWQIRNMVEVGEYYMVLTQGCVRSDAPHAEKMPGAYLMPKRHVESAPDLVHLFDADIHSHIRTGFTYSRASRKAKDGTFFTYRSNTDVFPFGHRILKWDISFS